MKLICHPRFPNPAVLSIECLVKRMKTKLVLQYCLCGDLSRIRLPQTSAAGKADELWRHTCFEVFIAPGGGREYHEYNFSPSGEWASYSFKDYRKRVAAITFCSAPETTVRQTEHRLELAATVALDRLRATFFSLGLAAVVEDENGSLSYWALNHPHDKPDFHHCDSFALQV